MCAPRACVVWMGQLMGSGGINEALVTWSVAFVKFVKHCRRPAKPSCQYHAGWSCLNPYHKGESLHCARTARYF